MPYTTLTLSTESGIARITLDRPEKRNAISPQMIDDLLAALDEVEESSARVCILTGSGKAFCSGMDLDELKALAGKSQEQNVEDSRHMAKMFYRLYSFPKPLIAAVNGAAIAGGCGIATLCDFTLAIPTAKFGYTEVKIGFIPALVSVFLTRQIGEKRARYLLLTGRIVDAADAHRLGLVTEVVETDRLAERADELAAQLLANSPAGLTRTKMLLHENAQQQIESEIERAVQANAAIRSTDDFKEGLASFLEKRPPNWSGK